jgi:transcriptional regulator with XRE-family HTH domain
MDSKKKIGKAIRESREAAGLSQEVLAAKSEISYQYLSAVENGRENFSIGVLEKITSSLGFELLPFLNLAFGIQSNDYPRIDPKNLRENVPLPGNLTASQVAAALNETQRIISHINSNLLTSGARTLQSYIQGNNFSALVSNILCDSFDQLTDFKHNSHQAYPDLIYTDSEGKMMGLEVKSTINVGKGGESHNGHSGWHLIACFHGDQENGNIRFVHAMFGQLSGHTERNPDWKYLGSRENPETGSRRTETYTTNLYGTTKLRDGTVYLDPDVVDFKRWRQQRHGKKPSYSIFL